MSKATKKSKRQGQSVQEILLRLIRRAVKEEDVEAVEALLDLLECDRRLTALEQAVERLAAGTRAPADGSDEAAA